VSSTNLGAPRASVGFGGGSDLTQRPAEGADEGLDDAFHQCLHDVAERGADHDADGQIDHAAAHDEFLEATDVLARLVQRGSRESGHWGPPHLLTVNRR